MVENKYSQNHVTLEKIMTLIYKVFLYILGIPNTIIFNFTYLPFRQAIKFPVLISHRVWLKKLSGEVRLSIVKPGLIKIGFGDVAIFDSQKCRSIWEVSGLVEFNGRATIGHGSKISVHGNLMIGDGLLISAECSIVAHKQIKIGKGVIISWDTLIMDTDLHHIFDANNKLLNSPSAITIGDSVWIGCRALILKGVNIADGVVIAAASTVCKPIDTPNSIAAGNPARVVKHDISWKL